MRVEDALSSRSLKRLWVNFQTKNAMTPMTATPPATESPIIVEVEVPLLLELLLSEAAVEDAEEDEEAEEAVAVTNTTEVSVSPSALVVMIWEDWVVSCGVSVCCSVAAVVVVCWVLVG